MAKILSDMIGVSGVEVRSWWESPFLISQLVNGTKQFTVMITIKIHFLSSHVIGLPFGMHMTDISQESVVNALVACI